MIENSARRSISYMTCILIKMLLFLVFIGVLSAHAQFLTVSKCLPHGEYAPALVANPGTKITFQCGSATPLDLIRSVGFQTRTPIGIVVGADIDALSKSMRAYDFLDVDAHTALSQAIEDTGYSIHDENGVTVLIAGDLTPRQQEVLHHAHPGFGGTRSDKMTCWGIALTVAIRQAMHPMTGFGISCSTSTNDEQFALDLSSTATTEQIANAIVSKGSHGIWLLKLPASSTAQNPTEEIDILPYQHYSNRPVTLH